MRQLTFLGAVGTVTGSKHLLEIDGKRILFDCGLFQGFKNLRQLNWRRLPVDPASLDAVVLSHAHLDHSGYLPLLVKHGFKGAITCTEGTADLVRILLPDAAFIEEETAERANRHGYTRHEPARPLFTIDDAHAALRHLRPVPFGEALEIDGLTVRFDPAGHIVGAAITTVEKNGWKLVYTGDLGRKGDPLMVDPTIVSEADVLIIESTYGNRTHPDSDPEEDLAEVVRRTVKRGGKLIIPAFAVGRTQRMLYHLWKLGNEARIPAVPIYLNSPLAQQATDIFRAHVGIHQLPQDVTDAVCDLPTVASSVEESKALNQLQGPAILIAGSGMVSGGRVIHHIRSYGADARNTILLTGFQAPGTRGASLLAGIERLKIFGQYVPIEAEVLELENLSAHADRDDLLEWMRHIRPPHGRTFVVHGNPESSDALRLAIEDELGWARVDAPIYGDVERL